LNFEFDLSSLSEGPVDLLNFRLLFREDLFLPELLLCERFQFRLQRADGEGERGVRALHHLDGGSNGGAIGGEGGNCGRLLLLHVHHSAEKAQ